MLNLCQYGPSRGKVLESLQHCPTPCTKARPDPLLKSFMFRMRNAIPKCQRFLGLLLSLPSDNPRHRGNPRTLNTHQEKLQCIQTGGLNSQEIEIMRN
jgi:hypothetical protein